MELRKHGGRPPRTYSPDKPSTARHSRGTSAGGLDGRGRDWEGGQERIETCRIWVGRRVTTPLVGVPPVSIALLGRHGGLLFFASGSVCHSFPNAVGGPKEASDEWLSEWRRPRKEGHLYCTSLGRFTNVSAHSVKQLEPHLCSYR